MNNKESNLVQLVLLASALGDLLPQVTFVGGSTAVLLVDEAAYHGIRKTDDVDVIIDVTTRVEQYAFANKLRKLGFTEDGSGPICRWLFNSKIGLLKLDVMPTDEQILAFSNRWYQSAIEKATEFTLPCGINIRVVSPAYFLATKFEAFAGRGMGDYFSHDIEDIIFVMENRRRIIIELMDCDDELKKHFSHQATLMLNDDFLNVLPGLLNNSDSAEVIYNNLKIMKSWGFT